jgi:hypothetical protein
MNHSLLDHSDEPEQIPVLEVYGAVDFEECGHECGSFLRVE